MIEWREPRNCSKWKTFGILHFPAQDQCGTAERWLKDLLLEQTALWNSLFFYLLYWDFAKVSAHYTYISLRFSLPAPWKVISSNFINSTEEVGWAKQVILHTAKEWVITWASHYALHTSFIRHIDVSIYLLPLT